MSARLLPFVCLTAMLFGFVDAASARPRRAARRSFQAVPVVTPPARESLRQVIYSVADLVVPIPSRATLDVEPLPRTMANVKEVSSVEVPAGCSFEECALSPLLSVHKPRKLLRSQTLEHDLMDLVKSTVAPKTWDGAGGSGSIQYYPLGMAIVVNQTLAVHEEVKALLTALRRQQDLEAVVETRIVTLTPAVFEKACKQLNITAATERDNSPVTEEHVVGPKGKRWTANLDQCQVRELLNLVQADPSANVMQAPKITMFPSQIASMEASENRFYLTQMTLCLDADAKSCFVPTQTPFTTGLRFGLQPVVAADRRSTNLKMKGYWCQLTGPVTMHGVEVMLPNEEGKKEKVPFAMFLQKPKFSQVRLDEDINLADGASALVSCGVVPVEVAREDLSAYWHCLWTGEKLTTSAERHVFFLVTSRIIVNEEQEVESVPTAVTSPRERQR